MTTAVQTLLNSFRALSEPEKHEAAVEIMKQSVAADAGDLSNATLCELADELFQVMDRCESENAKT